MEWDKAIDGDPHNVYPHHKKELPGNLCRHYKSAIDDKLTSWHSTVDAFPTAKAALEYLIQIEIATALDPSVSKEAAELIQKGRLQLKEDLKAKLGDWEYKQLQYRAGPF